MLYGVGFAPETDDGHSKDQLLREADEAFAAHDRKRCMDAISQIYRMFDEELIH